MAESISAPSANEAPASDVENLRLLASLASDILVRADGDAITYISPACRRLGWEPEELIGRPPTALVHPDDIDRFRANVAQLFSGAPIDRTVDREFRYRRKDGEWVWLEGNPRIVSQPGRPPEIVNIFRDVTHRRQLREAQADQARFRALAKAVAGVGYWRLDVRTQEITWSEQMFLTYGLEPAAEPPLELAMAMVHPDDRTESNERLRRALETGQGWGDGLTRLLRPDGEIRYVEGRGICEHDETGALRSIIGTMVDITDRKRAEIALTESEHRFRQMADNAPDMVAESRLDGVLTYVSPACLTITGFTPAELIGRTSASLMHPEDAEKVRRMCHAVFVSKGAIAPWPVEFRLRTKDGRAIWLECKPTLAVDSATGRFTGINDVIRDITARKTLEAELRHAQAEAEAAAAIKGEFLANMSHEIRTPLTAIIGFSGLLSERPNLDDVARGHLQRITTASRALHALVNDVLDFSKLEAGQVELALRPVDPVGFAHETLVMFSPQADAKGLALDFVTDGELPAFLSFDPDRLRQILLNLLGNALKFTSQGSVRLRLRYDSAQSRLHMAVEDTGPGLAPEDQAKLFQRFAQVDGSTTRRHGGTGLGLAICKGLTEAMGGEIDIHSELGAGSIFSLFVVAPETTAPASTTQAGAPLLDGVRVLIVDDNQANRDVARAILEQAGVEVSEADGGEAAVQLAAITPFDLILLDYRMPGVDGPQALRRIRAEDGPNRSIPILGFSADAELSGLADAGGFDGAVAKPINAATLIQAVATWTDWETQASPMEGDHADAA